MPPTGAAAQPPAPRPSPSPVAPAQEGHGHGPARNRNPETGLLPPLPYMLRPDTTPNFRLYRFVPRGDPGLEHPPHDVTSPKIFI